MKYLILILLIFPSFVLAQSNGTSGTAPVQAQAQATPAAVRTVQPITSPSVLRSPTPSPSLKPSTPISPESLPIQSQTNSTGSGIIWSIIVLAILGFLSLFTAMKMKFKDTKESINKCDSIKELLEQKKKELQEMVKNYPQDKFKEMAEGKITEQLGKNEETKRILDVKKKYDATKNAIDLLQKKYDLCILTLPSLNLIKAVIFDFNGVLVNNGWEIPEMISLVKELKKKEFKLFIISNAMIGETEMYTRNFAFIDELFDKAYFSSQTGLAKPDPEAYRLILSENDLKPGECIYFDDSEINVKAASEQGIKSYVFINAEKTRKILGL